jgi:RNA polymerase sigma-70 factor (ECF subfamily)
MPFRGLRYEDLPEEELVRNFAESGDTQSFAELFRRHSRKVYQACFAFFGDSGMAQDATQETFLRAYQKKDRFHDGDYLGWLHRIARNVCIDEWRKKRPEVPIDGPEDEPSVQLPSPAPDESLQLALQQLHKEMAKLPGDQRRCLELKIEGYSYEETAEKTGLTVEAVRSHLQNGRRTLRQRMQGVLSI